MNDSTHTTELSPIAIHLVLEQAAASQWHATLAGPAGWRATGTVAAPDPTGRLPFRSPWGVLGALPVGSSVRLDLQGDRGTVSFYTSTRGTDGQGRWLLEVPSILQIIEHRQDPRLDVDPGRLSLALEGHGAMEVIDLSPRGVGFRAPAALARDLEAGGPMQAVLSTPGGEPIPVQLCLRSVVRAPGQPLMRIVGARFAGSGDAVMRWFADKADDVGAYAA